MHDMTEMIKEEIKNLKKSELIFFRTTRET